MASQSPRRTRLLPILGPAHLPIYVLDSKWRVVYVNTAWEHLTGYSSQQALSPHLVCRPRSLTDPDWRVRLGSCLYPPSEALHGHRVTCLVQIPHVSGQDQERRSEFLPFLDADGTVLGLLVLIHEPNTDSVEAGPSRTRRWQEALERVLVESRRRDGPHEPVLVGTGLAHQRLLDQVRAASAFPHPLGIVGEPGTGKTHVAALLAARLADGRPVRRIDCQAVPPEEVATILNGPSDPLSETTFRWDVGPIVLDEVHALARDLQARLVDALRDPEVRVSTPLVATWTRSIDPDHDPEASWIPELRAILTAHQIELVPLRDRLEDVPLLAQYRIGVLNGMTETSTPPRTSFQEEAINALRSYDWPGNVGELFRVIDAAHRAANGPEIGLEAIPGRILGEQGAAYVQPAIEETEVRLDDALTLLERRLIEDALRRARRNKSRAADLLAISRPRLYRRMRELGIPDEAEGSSQES